MDVTAGGEQLIAAMAGSDAVINAAAASSPEPGTAEAIDREAALACIRAAGQAGVSRFVQISSMFADRPEQGPPFLQAVLRAKQTSDQALQTSSLVWTTVRPAGLTDDDATGLVEVGRHLSGSTIPRADVAAATVACLAIPATHHRAFDIHGGSTEIVPALSELERAGRGT